VSSNELGLAEATWQRLGRELRGNLAGGALLPSRFVPRGPVVVEAQPQELGRAVVTVEAPDGVGLLHAAAAWFEAHGCNVEACRAGAEGGQARGVFIVMGSVDTAALAGVLGGPDVGSVVTRVATTPFHLVAASIGTGCGVLTGVLRTLRHAVSPR
jgi:hypothetical protein